MLHSRRVLGENVSATQVNQLSNVSFSLTTATPFCTATPELDVIANEQHRRLVPEDAPSQKLVSAPSAITLLGSGLCPEVAPVSYADQKKHAASLNDIELCDFLEVTFAPAKRAVAYNLPYLAEARERFAKQGRRLPVSGQPSWSEWISDNLGISDRHVRRLLVKYRIETGQQPVAKPSKPKSRDAKKILPSMTKTDLGAAVRRKLVATVETAERYIRVLEALVHSQAVTLTEEQRKTLQKPMEDWRSILRYARGIQAERAGKTVSSETAPAALKGVA
jgi:hypothetical protein